jgi:thiosulfate/3-mercaptopyruvate sulfurtransferase
MTADELARLLEEGAVQLLDVRSQEEYIGAAGYPCDPAQGHIPGAVHLEWSSLYRGDGLPLERDALRALLSETGVDPDVPIVAYCHSGQRSQMACAALRAAGIEHAASYDGSWHEWSRRPPT